MQMGDHEEVQGAREGFFIEQISQALTNGYDPSQVTFRGQHIKHWRVTRHLRSKTRKGDAGPRFRGGGIMPTGVSRGDVSVDYAAFIALRPIGKATPQELILHATNSHITSFGADSLAGGRILVRVATWLTTPTRTSSGMTSRPPCTYCGSGLLLSGGVPPMLAGKSIK